MLFRSRIASAIGLQELEELQIEVIDRFGLLPDSGKNLFRLTAMRLQSAQLGICKMEIGENGGAIEFIDNPPINPAAILSLVQRDPHQYQLAGPSKLKLIRDFSDPAVRLNQVEKLLDNLIPGLLEQYTDQQPAGSLSM